MPCLAAAQAPAHQAAQASGSPGGGTSLYRDRVAHSTPAAWASLQATEPGFARLLPWLAGSRVPGRSGHGALKRGDSHRRCRRPARRVRMQGRSRRRPPGRLGARPGLWRRRASNRQGWQGRGGSRTRARDPPGPVRTFVKMPGPAVRTFVRIGISKIIFDCNISEYIHQ